MVMSSPKSLVTLRNKFVFFFQRDKNVIRGANKGRLGFLEKQLQFVNSWNKDLFTKMSSD